MRALALLVAFAACQRGPSGAVDIAALEKQQHPATRDILTLIGVNTPRLSRCADPVRGLVAINRGRVGVVLDVVGSQGRAVVVTAVTVEPLFSTESGFAECVERTFLTTAPVTAATDYRLKVRIHLCIDPAGAS